MQHSFMTLFVWILEEIWQLHLEPTASTVLIDSAMAPQRPKGAKASILPQGLLLFSSMAAWLVLACSFLLNSSHVSPFQLPSSSTSASPSFVDLIKARRTYYSLNDSLPVSKERVTSLVGDLVQAVPSAYNSQTNRAVVLFGDDHRKL